jgi:nucleoside-diphosphate-sugar epimerase
MPCFAAVIRPVKLFACGPANNRRYCRFSWPRCLPPFPWARCVAGWFLNVTEGQRLTAAVARHYGVEALVNMSQMTVWQMSISETTDSPQHKLHCLAEQALSWSGLPVITVRPTIFLEGFFLLLAAVGVRASDELALPMGGGKTSPISAVDVARAVATILDDPTPHIGQIYDLTGPESADLDHFARVFAEALGRPIRYRDVSLQAWSEGLRQAKLPEHLVRHLSAMAELTRQGRYDRMTDTMFKLTGEAPMSMQDFVKLHAAEFKQREAAHS